MQYLPIDLAAPEPAQDRRARLQVRVLAVASAVLLVLGLAGVALIDPESDGRSGGPLATVLAAAGKTVDASSVRLSSQTTLAVGGDIDIDIPAISMEGAVEFSGERGSLVMRFGDVTIETLSDGGVAYVKVPQRARSRVGTPWVSMAVANLPDGQADIFEGLSGPFVPGGGDPTGTLEAIRENGAVQQVSRLGNARVRGETTTVYRVQLDAERFESMLDAVPAAGMVEFSLDDPILELSVDGDGLVRRTTLRVGMSVQEGDDDATVQLASTTEFFDFGVPIRIDVPPPDQVTRLGSMAEMTGLFAGWN